MHGIDQDGLCQTPGAGSGGGLHQKIQTSGLKLFDDLIVSINISNAARGDIFLTQKRVAISVPHLVSIACVPGMDGWNAPVQSVVAILRIVIDVGVLYVLRLAKLDSETIIIEYSGACVSRDKNVVYVSFLTIVTGFNIRTLPITLQVRIRGPSKMIKYSIPKGRSRKVAGT